MKRAIAIILLFITEVLFLRSWLLCRELKDFFYFSSQNIQLIIIDHIHNDIGIPILIVRMLHNKATVALVELIRHYLYFWDVRFLLPLISPLGVFALFVGLWYAIRSTFMPGKYKLGLLTFLLCIPLIEMFFKPQQPFAIRLILLGTPYILLSIIGIWHFLATKRLIRYIIFVSLFLLSVWWYAVFQTKLLNFCVKL